MSKRVCPKCGKELQDNEQFCGGCGEKVSNIVSTDINASDDYDKTMTMFADRNVEADDADKTMPMFADRNVEANDADKTMPLLPNRNNNEDRGMDVKCPGCNEDVKSNDEFCSFCGFKVKDYFSNANAFNGPKKTTDELMPDANQNMPSKAKKSKKKTLLIIIPIIVILLLGGVAAYLYFASPKTFTWLCSHDKKIDATCTEDEYCDRCGKTFDEATGHDWKSATCTKPKTCRTCGATEGNAKGHDWKAATCTEPKTCKTCGEIDGKATGHNWEEATCTDPKRCKTCGTTDGSALGHKMDNYVCKRCGYKEDISKYDVQSSIIKIPHVNSSVNDGLIDIEIEICNKSNKTIEHTYIKAVFMDEDGHEYYNNTMYTNGYTYANSSKKYEWYGLFRNYDSDESTGWNEGGHLFRFDEIKILYSDGTSITLSGEKARYAYQ